MFGRSRGLPYGRQFLADVVLNSSCRFTQSGAGLENCLNPRGRDAEIKSRGCGQDFRDIGLS